MGALNLARVSQKRLVTSFKYKPEMFRFGKVTLGNLKIGKMSITSKTLNFLWLFVMKFVSKLSCSN